MPSIEELMESDAGPVFDLERIRTAVKDRIGLDHTKADLEERLTEVNKKINELDYETLPQLFAEGGVSKIGVPASGNNPPYLAELNDYTHANIAAKWDDERRSNAFSILERIGLGSIIRRLVTITFDVGDRVTYDKVIKGLVKLGVDFKVKEDVPWSTLTSSLKEMRKKNRLPGIEELNAIGATIGKIVKIKEE
jgi:hypothetical protein